MCADARKDAKERRVYICLAPGLFTAMPGRDLAQKNYLRDIVCVLCIFLCDEDALSAEISSSSFGVWHTDHDVLEAALARPARIEVVGGGRQVGRQLEGLALVQAERTQLVEGAVALVDLAQWREKRSERVKDWIVSFRIWLTGRMVSLHVLAKAKRPPSQ